MDRVTHTGYTIELRERTKRRGARPSVGQVRGGHDLFVVAGTPLTTYSLTYIPVDGTCELVLNGSKLREDTDYTCDYDTGIVTVAASLSGGDDLSARYLKTDWLVARSLPPDVGISPGLFIAGAGSGNSSNSASVSIPGSRATGDLMIYAVLLFDMTALTTPPSGWTHEGSDTHLAVYSKISDGTETTVTAGLSGSVGWAAEVQVYRGDGIRIASSAFGPSATTTTTCTLPTAAVSGDPLLVGIWGGIKSFSGSISLTPPAGTSDLTTGVQPGDCVIAASEALTGVSTTPALTATASATADLGWGAAVLTVAVDG